jgi:hypothetical protein
VARRILLPDTDIGTDADDAVALSLALAGRDAVSAYDILNRVLSPGTPRLASTPTGSASMSWNAS